LTLAQLIKQLELFENPESLQDVESRTYWNPPPDRPYSPPDRRKEVGRILIGKPGFRAFADVCAHLTRTGLPEAEFAKELRDCLAIRLGRSRKEIGRLDVREAIEKFYGSVPLQAEVFEAPPPAPSGPRNATEGQQGSEAPLPVVRAAPPPPPTQKKARTRRRKGEAKDLLAATIRSLTSKGQWGETDRAIISLAGISPDSFYRLTGEGGALNRDLNNYRRENFGRGPADPRDR
jgi:hypothetical protein